MSELRGWMIYSWIALPTVMYGGYALLRLLTQGNAATPFRLTWFRAGHAHAGVLLLMSLLYYTYMDKTSLSAAVKHAGCATLIVGILAQSGGFFLHMVKGQPDRASIGTTVTTIGAVNTHLRHCRIGLWVVYRALSSKEQTQSGNATTVFRECEPTQRLPILARRTASPEPA